MDLIGVRAPQFDAKREKKTAGAVLIKYKMLPSKGYFSTLICPYHLAGNCQRPHCHYKHPKIIKNQDEKEKENNELKPVNEAKEKNVTFSVVKPHIPVVCAPAKPTTMYRRKSSPYSSKHYVPTMPNYSPTPSNVPYKPSILSKKIESVAEYAPKRLYNVNCTLKYTPKKNIDTQTDTTSNPKEDEKESNDDEVKFINACTNVTNEELTNESKLEEQAIIKSTGNIESSTIEPASPHKFFSSNIQCLQSSNKAKKDIEVSSIRPSRCKLSKSAESTFNKEFSIVNDIDDGKLSRSPEIKKPKLSQASIYERWVKAKERISKSTPTVTFTPISRLPSKHVSKKENEEIERPEPKIIKRSAHAPKTSLLNYPKVILDRDIKIVPAARQNSLNSIYDEFLKYVSAKEAHYNAIEEEFNIAKRMQLLPTYKNAIALLIMKIRKNEGNIPAKPDEPILTSSSIPPFTYGLTLYECCKKYLMSESDLFQNGFPCKIDGKPNCAFLNTKGTKLPLTQKGKKRVCDNCKLDYTLDKNDMPVMIHECKYHWGKAYRTKTIAGFMDLYSCCRQEQFSSGCQIGQFHVSNTFDWDCLDKFVSTKMSDDDEKDAGIYAIDCEMCHTTKGLELTRCTVLDLNGKVIYDRLVQPDNPILDYCTRFSGITEKSMISATTKLKDVQKQLLELFNNKTILIGHSLENDMKVLRILHDKIVDTSIIFPHSKGTPYKRALKNIVDNYLQRQIQENESGHDSKEDAQACLDLVLMKIKQDLKSRKPRVIISLPGKQIKSAVANKKHKI